MPIRFRCAYCNQLMGIARRKAGTVVTCPRCSGQVLVPNAEDGGEAAEDAGRPAEAPQPLFERSDFEKLFEAAPEGDQPQLIKTNPAPPPAAPGAWKPAADAGFDVEPVPLTGPGLDPRGPGVWLSPAVTTLLSVLAVLALALAFGVGLLLGLYLRSEPGEPQTGRFCGFFG